MSIKKIRAVEYNAMMSLMKLFGDRLPELVEDYGWNKDIPIDILPAYPRDLTKLHMPSIIVRKVENYQSKVSLDGFIGQYYEEQTNTLMDVKAIRHNMCYQFDIIAPNNSQLMFIQAIIDEGIFGNILLNEKGYIPLYDFLDDIDNPNEVGTLCMIGAPKDINLSTWRTSVQEPTINENAMLIRQNFALIQTVIPKQEFVDLSLWIKQHITVKINKEE